MLTTQLRIPIKPQSSCKPCNCSLDKKVMDAMSFWQLYETKFKKKFLLKIHQHHIIDWHKYLSAKAKRVAINVGVVFDRYLGFDVSGCSMQFLLTGKCSHGVSHPK